LLDHRVIFGDKKNIQCASLKVNSSTSSELSLNKPFIVGH